MRRIALWDKPRRSSKPMTQKRKPVPAQWHSQGLCHCIPVKSNRLGLGRDKFTAVPASRKVQKTVWLSSYSLPTETKVEPTGVTVIQTFPRPHAYGVLPEQKRETETGSGLVPCPRTVTTLRPKLTTAK